ncbi:MAG: glycine cleavage system protein R [Hyphomicrobiales bacterium]
MAKTTKTSGTGDLAGKTDTIVFTALARDRPGLVERLAETVALHSGNWVDSSMSRLGGEFAGIVRVDVPDMKVAELKQALAGLARERIDVIMHEHAGGPAPEGMRARLEFTGLDHPGIVLEVTRALTRHGVSIEELETAVSRGSMGAEPMFRAEAEVVLPDRLDMGDLRGALEEIAQDIMVDIHLEASA